jgi:probable HAF family extracellular repeat protein
MAARFSTPRNAAQVSRVLASLRQIAVWLRRPTVGSAAACLLLSWVPGGVAADALYPNNVSIDGHLCEVQEIVFSDTTTKAGAYPVGSRLLGLRGQCSYGGTLVKRSLIVVQPAGGGPDEVMGANSADGARALIAAGCSTDPFVFGTFESTGSSFQPYHAFRFDVDTKAFLDLGAFGGPAGTSSALGASIDGAVVVGASNLTTAGASVWQAFRWTPALGLRNLGSIAPGGYSEARATSLDGTVVVGGSDFPGATANDFSSFRAFRWALTNPATGAGTMTDLGPATYEALAVNGDGSVIAGIGNRHAFRWTPDGGAVDLGALPGHVNSMATAVSADGKVIVGISSANFITSSYPAPGPVYDSKARAFRWTQATGMRDLNLLLADAGVDLTGVTLTGALGLSHDGQTISGTGIRNGANGTSGFSLRYADATTGGVPTVPNYQGMWWNAQESGWGINFAHQGDTLFATWFTFGADGKPLWLVGAATKTADKVYSGKLYTGTGPAFDAVPFDPAKVAAAEAGTATFTFTGNGAATFAYTLDGVSQSKAITRQQFGTTIPACAWGLQPDLARATNYQDIWWASPAGSESGWGINLAHQGDTIFATWFTFDHEGKPWWLVVAASKTGDKAYSGTLYTGTGPAFSAVPFDPSKVAGTPVGTATITFADGNRGTFAYTVNGVAQTKAITRQIFAAPGTLCE